MLKETVTYKNPFTGEEVVEDLYFNLSKAELIDILLHEEEYLEELKKIDEKAEIKEVLITVKDLIRRSYGVKEGDSFVKGAGLFERFSSTESYSTFLYDLFIHPEKLVNFMEKILPEELLVLAKQEMEGRKMPQDHLPKEIKTVELPREDGKPYFDKEATEKSREEATPIGVTDDEFEAYKKWRSEQGYK